MAQKARQKRITGGVMQLYARSQHQQIEGHSKMTKRQLENALRVH
jgi:hypothetical protein